MEKGRAGDAASGTCRKEWTPGVAELHQLGGFGTKRILSSSLREPEPFGAPAREAENRP